MAQTLDYSSLIDAGTGWSNGSNVQSQNGVYAVCDLGGPGTSGYLKIALDGGIDPKIHTSHIITIRGKRNTPIVGTGGHTVTFELRQSGTLRASYSFSFGTTDSDKSYTLTSGEAAAISSYSSGLQLWVKVEVEGGDDGYAVVSVDYEKLSVPDLELPAAITGVSAEDGNASRVRVTWNSDSLADDYNIYRNTSNSWSGATKIQDGDAGSPYDDTPTAGILYWYGVRGSNTTGEGPTGTMNSGYRLAAPSAPTMTGASDGTFADKIRVTGADTSGSYDTASTFKLYRNTVNDSGTATLVTSGLGSPTYDDTYPAGFPGDTFYYWWKATNAAGDSGFSSADTGFSAAAHEGYGSSAMETWAEGVGSVGTVWTGTGASYLDTYAFGIGDVGSGGLYGRLDRYAWGYVWDQRPATLKLAAVNERGLVSGPIIILKTESTRCTPKSATQVGISLGDISRRLDIAASRVTLNGSGGNEGTAENEGQRCPIVIGLARHIPGVRLSPVHQRWLLHRDFMKNQIQSLDAVYAGGNLFDPEQYELIYDPVDGSNIVEINGTDVLDGVEVAFDVRGPLLSSGISEVTPADALQYMSLYDPAGGYSDIGALSSDQIAWDRLDLLRQDVPFEIGYYISDDKTLAAAIDEIFMPWGWWGMNSQGQLDCGLNLPSIEEEAEYELDKSHIIDVDPPVVVSPAKQVVVGYDRNWKELTADQVVGAAQGTDLAQWVVKPYRELSTTSGSWTYVYPTARTPEPYVTPFLHSEDAKIVQGWIGSTVGAVVRFYTLLVDLTAIRFEIGRVIQISWPRWGMDIPSNYRIAGISLTEDWKVKLVVWSAGPRYVLAGDETGLFLADHNGAPLGV